ncbi:hypothetical protein C8D92_103120 [Tamilnaduibacter salinus]|uniref:DUF3034 family protein n=1 Tax=Tamilnaduibacter salinus TaxID=1484056 RepID=A0A2U1CY51_9GAMM|nr:DUF3034 family protein [Tamilnaduibacter salinus]PVY77435.1 hypothetical protein C8D92_103120 [Tamilnaduibacter salinus]
MTHVRSLASLLVLTLMPGLTVADVGSRLWATGGVTTIEGSAGGGLVPMAVLSGYASDTEWGGTASLSRLTTDGYSFHGAGATVSAFNRVELSVARQTLDLDTLGASLGQDELAQTVYGLKVRAFGDLIYDPLGQWSVGIQHKRNTAEAISNAIGSRDNTGTDVYISGSRLFLAAVGGRNLLINGTLRATRANQTGLLGFGGDRNDDHELMAELSAGLLLNRHWLVGMEYRQKPDNLSFAREQDARDFFVAWFPHRRVSVTAAWVQLGDIAGLSDQQGPFAAIEASF